MRDRIVVAVCNFIIDKFASEYYRKMFRSCVIFGMAEMDRIATETPRKTK